jgi:hypothetical protein
MTAPPLSIVPILATPFGVVPLPAAEALNPSLVELFAGRIRAGAAAPMPTSDANTGSYNSRDDLLEWPEQPTRQLAAEMFRGVYSVIESVNDFHDAELRSLKLEARAWFTVIKQDGYLPATNHPLTAWCAIYCVASPGPSATRQDSGVLRLHESRLATMFQDSTTSVMRFPFTPSHYGWRPVPGQMAVFPASVTHEIAMVRSPGELVLVTARLRFVGPRQQGIGRW